MKTAVARVCGFLLIWAVLFLAFSASVYHTAGDGDLLAREMLRHAPPEMTGLPEAEYPGTARMIAAYLTGKEENFQYTFTDTDGQRYLCFQPHEAEHMADCRELIRLAGTVRWVSGGIMLVLAGAGILLLRCRKAFAGGIFTGLCAAGLVLTGLVVWAAVNFDGLFVTFHRVVFTNEGWLLNPRTDLLIRLMPVSFFTALAAGVTLRMLAAMLAAGAAAWIMRKWEGIFRFAGKSCEL